MIAGLAASGMDRAPSTRRENGVLAEAGRYGARLTALRSVSGLLKAGAPPKPALGKSVSCKAVVGGRRAAASSARSKDKSRAIVAGELKAASKTY